MTISHIATVTGASSVTFSSVVRGDLLIIGAFTNDPSTVPTKPSGFTEIINATRTGAYDVLYYKIAAGGETSITVTNAFACTGTQLRSTKGFMIGASAGTTGATSSASIPALTLQDTSGASWVYGHVGSRATGTAGTPGTLTKRGQYTAAAQSSEAYDTNAGVSSWSAATVTLGATVSWCGVAIEIRELNETTVAGFWATPTVSPSNTLAISGQQVGDLLIGSFCNNGAYTAAALPTGWTALMTKTQAGASVGMYMLIACKLSDGTEASVVSTNATYIQITALRGRKRLKVGARDTASANSATVGFPALSLEITDATSMVLAGFLVQNAGGAPSTPPSGMSLVGGNSANQGTYNAASQTSWAGATKSVTSGGHIEFSLEIAEVASNAHRAYRYLFISGQNTEIDIGWIKLHADYDQQHATGVSLTSTKGGSAFASGTSGGSAAGPFNYANSSTNYNWYLAGGASGGSIGWDFGAGNEQVVVASSISGYNNYAPKSFKVQYCDDPGTLTTWVDLVTDGPDIAAMGGFTPAYAGPSSNAGFKTIIQPDTSGAGHRYWRVYWAGSQGSGSDDLGYRDIHLRSAVNSDILFDWGTIRTDSTAAGSFHAINVINNSTADAGFTAANGTANARFFAFDLGKNTELTELELVHYTTTYYRPTIKVDYSDDGSTWTNATTLTGQAGKATLALTTISITSATNGNATGTTSTVTASLIDGTATGTATGSASGATLTATASLIEGTASVVLDGNASGATLTATASLIAGTASATGDGSATGDTLTATASLVDGVATGEENGTASGATLTASASLVDGVATGEINGVASGVTLTATASLIDGTASTILDGNASGDTIAATASLIEGAATSDVAVPGEVLTVTGSLIPGTAAVVILAPGATVAATASVTAGTARGGATGAGDTLTAATSFVRGDATGDANAAGKTLGASASIIPGLAVGGQVAGGATLTATMAVLAGEATTNANVAGQVLDRTLSVVDGTPTGNAATPVRTLPLAASIDAGIAQAGNFALGDLLRVNTALVRGVATGDANVAGQTLTCGGSVVEGTASADNAVDGQILTALEVTVIEGTADGGARASGAVILISRAITNGTANGTANGSGQTLSRIMTLIPGNANFAFGTPGEVGVPLPQDVVLSVPADENYLVVERGDRTLIVSAEVTTVVVGPRTRSAA